MIMENKNYRQQGFCDSGAKLQSSTAVLRFNFSAKLKFCASIAPPLQSPETLPAILPQKTSNIKIEQNEIKQIIRIKFGFIINKLYGIYE